MACGFDYTRPEEREQGFRKARISLNNTDLVITPILRGLPNDVAITVEQVTSTDLESTPPIYDIVEGGSVPYMLQSADYDTNRAQLTIIWDDITNSQFPINNFNIHDFAGAHK